MCGRVGRYDTLQNENFDLENAVCKPKDNPKANYRLYDNVFESELLEILQLSDDETAASDLGASTTQEAIPAGAFCNFQQVMGDRWGR